MPRLSNPKVIWDLYNPVRRVQSFPRAGWAFQVRAALNLAAAFDEAHRFGHVVGDVQMRNAYVLPQATVFLGDCDSFQVRANGRLYTTDVGTPLYVPPELVGKPLRGVERTVNHDGFGLAVLIFQLLFAGRHPYAGVYTGPGEPDPDRMIAEYRFAHGPRAASWGMKPPPHAPTLTDVPPDLGALFRRAFERGSEAGTRPRPAEWVAALKRLEPAIATCGTDGGHTYWRGAGTCVWCRLASNGGPEYYFGVAGSAVTFGVDEAKLRDVLARLEAIRELDFRCDPRVFRPPAPPDPAPLPPGLDDHRTMATVVGSFAAFCALLVPFGLLHVALRAVGLLGVAVFGLWAAVLVVGSPWREEFRRRRKSRETARSRLAMIEDEWEGRAYRYRQQHTESDRTVRRLVSECRGLMVGYQSELGKLTAAAEAAARLRHLRLHFVADADIPLVGAGRKQTLAANGINTAADLNPTAVRQIKGFGNAITSNLMTWRDDVLRRFRFDPTTAVAPADRRAVSQRFAARQQQLFADMDRRLAEREALAPACRADLEALAPALRAAVAAVEQAEADLRVMEVA